jgi:hypothetical protein
MMDSGSNFGRTVCISAAVGAAIEILFNARKDGMSALGVPHGRYKAIRRE